MFARIRSMIVNLRVKRFMKTVPESIKARDFGRRIKEYFNSYRDVTHRRLAYAFVAQYPEYIGRVKF